MTIGLLLFIIYATIAFCVSFVLTMRWISDSERDISLGDFMFFVMCAAYFGACGIIALPFYLLFAGVKRLVNNDLTYAAAVLSGRGKEYKAEANRKASR